VPPKDWLISCKRPERTCVPQPHWEGHQATSLAPSAFVGCISGLGSDGRSDGRVHPLMRSPRRHRRCLEPHFIRRHEAQPFV
jgi:hypothetical protein